MEREVHTKSIYEDIDDYITKSHPFRQEYQHKPVRDRSDVYVFYGTSKNMNTFSVRLYYELQLIKCDPDYDW